MTNEYKDPYMPDEEELVEVGDYRPLGHEVHIKRSIGKKRLKERERLNFLAEKIWLSNLPNRTGRRDNRILCQYSSPWADCIEALEIYEQNP